MARKPAWLTILLIWTGLAAAQPPHLDGAGRDSWRAYQAAANPKAFAIAPGGAHGWTAEADNDDRAAAQALETCRAHTEQTCLLYDQSGARVFDQQRWPGLWTLPGDAAAGEGVKRGMRFPDLLLSDPKGKPLKLSDLSGRVRILHFWGSWCPHCQGEMPGFVRLARDPGSKHLAFLPIQVREDAASARLWLRQAGLAIPQYDGGATGPASTRLTLADGRVLPDRDIARAFPATYVLDRRGRVLFSRIGPVEDWSQYREFLRHAAR